MSNDERVRFRTATGSIYLLARTDEGMRWHRETVTLGSGVLRSEHGTLVAWPEVALGQRCELLSEPINPPLPRLVLTSEIVALLDEPAEGVS